MEATSALQLALFSDTDKRQYLVQGVDPKQCTISRFNTRKQRDPEHVKKLAERMLQNGFELTRALWAYPVNGGYEIFAGGTRLEAAKVAGVKAALVVHEGYDDRDIARLTDQDNENDEYHEPVRPMDVWAEYARLRDEEEWTQGKIAETKKISQGLVSLRLRYHDTLPIDIREALLDGVFTEGHLAATFGDYYTPNILPKDWADETAWRIELLRDCIQRPRPSRKLAEEWQRHKAAVARANELIATIPEELQDEYIYETGAGIQRVQTDYRQFFVDTLIDDAARTVAAVERAFKKVVGRQKTSDQRKTDYEANIEAERQAMLEEERRIAYIEARWREGDCLQEIRALEDGSVRLLLVDPPYGIDFQSNRRTASPKADKLDGDETTGDALALFENMLRAATPKLAVEAHLLIFTRWDVERFFMDALERAGFVLRGSLIWVKENHTSGDLTGGFAPKHERIIHATQGHPTISPRVDDVLAFPREDKTDHPTEKPIALLEVLINCTTQPGHLVIDPFGGVASTLIAAQKSGREWWGCELKREWWERGFERLKECKPA